MAADSLWHICFKWNPSLSYAADQTIYVTYMYVTAKPQRKFISNGPEFSVKLMLTSVRHRFCDTKYDIYIERLDISKTV